MLYQVEQFTDSGLSQFSYSILYDKKIVLIDPARDASIFYAYAKEKKASITAVIETHSHADFVSGHAEIQRKTGAKIYASAKLGAKYPVSPLKDGDIIPLNDQLRLKIIDTPGHSYDSISIVLEENGKDKIVFSGDSLLFGDVGRPDLREYTGDADMQRKTLAAAMYQTVRNKFSLLDDEVLLYPAHGAGSLCSGSTRNVRSSTIGYEKKTNYAFENLTERAFVDKVVSDQPYIPLYFPYNVELNKSGAEDLQKSIAAIQYPGNNDLPDENQLIVDGRPMEIDKSQLIDGAVHIPDGSKFETWLGTVVAPKQRFYLIAENKKKLHELIYKSSKIGYETYIIAGLVIDKSLPKK